ncbi:serine/threonine-protein kinase [Candidatus Frankia nodulisporulans]|uniref:serine/threonine-protein kinase n=2 Tax=Candidatus Frankia nodulisporulans TaxID=2060052 RepID=UPI0013D5518D|nr:serine/threonine-protein kinase [Candidatus Frankia nodulisporulans]
MAKSASVPRDTDRHGTPRYVAQRYRLDTPIGRGGAGVVWRGEDELLQRPVAIKEILVPIAGAQNERDAIRARVLREARALARLHSPAIVSVYDVVEEHERHWIVMELVDADSLGDVIRNHGPLPFDQVAAIGLALTDALAAAHSAGVLHRDVKPGNVLLGRDGRVRLTDFGIAATEGDVTLTGTGALVGSPAYIAPERVRGSSGSPASDLWGLGATLYSAVEGQPPFEGPETYAVLTAVVEGRRRAFRLAGPLRNLLSDLMDRPAEERPDVTEIRRRLIPVARNATPVPAAVMHARSKGDENDEQPGRGSSDVGLENLDDSHPSAPSTAPATSTPPWGSTPYGPSPTGPSADWSTADADAGPADTEITADPIPNGLDETAISPATGGLRRAPATPPASARNRGPVEHDEPTRIGRAGQATGPVRGGSDDETRIGTTPLIAATDLGMFEDDEAAGLVHLDDSGRRAMVGGGGAAAGAYGGRSRADEQNHRRRIVAIAAGAVAALAVVAVALALTLTGGDSPNGNDVSAQQTTGTPATLIPDQVTGPSQPANDSPAVVVPPTSRYSYRPQTTSPAPRATTSPTTPPTSAPATQQPTPSPTVPATTTPSNNAPATTRPPTTPTAPAPTTPVATPPPPDA